MHHFSVYQHYKPTASQQSRKYLFEVVNKYTTKISIILEAKFGDNPECYEGF